MLPTLLKDGFVAAFKRRIKEAQSVQIASAWMTESDALDALVEKKEKVQAIIGIHGNATTPESLTRLGAPCWTNIRIAKSTRLFHPKLFLFRLSEDRTIAWIGSANFTRHGMGENRELMLETDDETAVAALKGWFDQQWKSLDDQKTAELVRMYEARWEEPGPYEADRGPDLSSERLSNTTIQVLPEESPTRARRGSIVFGKGETERFETAAKCLLILLARLSGGRADDFFAHCRNESAFQTTKGHWVAKGRSEKEALEAGLNPRAPRPLPSSAAAESGWWVSTNSNSNDKWKMIRAAIKVANEHFQDGLSLENEELATWPVPEPNK